MKRIIFHIPNKINQDMPSGSQIRPLKMLQAFKDIGYEVDVVMGYVKERRKQIKQIKNNIKKGIKYDFLYSESSTMPTALTEKHHFPIAPLLDFSFFKFCKTNKIKIGLFYRDVYWVFNEYKESVSLYKRIMAIFFYNFDLYFYNKLLDTLFLPSLEMKNYIPRTINTNVKSLPPACDSNKYVVNERKDKIIYVGGVGNVYDLSLFLEALEEIEYFSFNLCVREKDWDLYKNKVESYLSKVKIFHKKTDELFEIYNDSSLANYFLKPSKIWNFAMGVKLFEYISYHKAIIAVKGTAVGTFVEKNDIGWVINYDKKSLVELLEYLKENPKAIQEKIENIKKIIPNNTWVARAKQVEKDLTL